MSLFTDFVKNIDDNSYGKGKRFEIFVKQYLLAEPFWSNQSKRNILYRSQQILNNVIEF